MGESPKRIAIGICGASGTVYAERLIEYLLPAVERIYLMITDSGEQVARHELTRDQERFSLLKFLNKEFPGGENKIVRMFSINDLFAPIASGTSAPTHMVVVPCSMGTLARISHGFSSNLLERSADVCLKQKKPLIICPRETPLNSIHLRNMLSLSEAGASILPTMPGFYHNPKNIDDLVDFVVGRIGDLLDLDLQLYQRWNQRMV
jgi:4-hydroxy-3-polyprenylbenzoate decarboxylase